MLDSWPAWLRDLSLVLLSAVLTWAAGWVPVLSASDRPWAPLAAGAIVALTTILTPLTRRYGAGAGTGTPQGPPAPGGPS